MRRVVLAVMLVMVASLTACGMRVDNHNAYVEVSTSTGKAEVITAYNETQSSNSKIDGLGLAVKNHVQFVLGEGETVNLHFVCDQCGHDEQVELVSPAAVVLSCDCGEGKENTTQKEYVAIAVVTEAEAEE